MENPGENFLSRAHKFDPPKSGGKAMREKCSHSTFTQMPFCSQRSQQLSKEERRQLSNHQLSTTQLSSLQPKNNSKSTQNNLKSTQTPIGKPIPNPTQNQPKTKSTQNQTQNPQKINSKSNPYVSIIFIFFIIIIFSLPCSFRTVKKRKKKKMQRPKGKLNIFHPSNQTLKREN